MPEKNTRHSPELINFTFDPKLPPKPTKPKRKKKKLNTFAPVIVIRHTTLASFNLMSLSPPSLRPHRRRRRRWFRRRRLTGGWSRVHVMCEYVGSFGWCKKQVEWTELKKKKSNSLRNVSISLAIVYCFDCCRQVAVPFVVGGCDGGLRVSDDAADAVVRRTTANILNCCCCSLTRPLFAVVCLAVNIAGAAAVAAAAIACAFGLRFTTHIRKGHGVM